MQRVFYVLLNFDGRIKRLTWLVFFLAISAAEYCCELLFRNVFHISGALGSGQGLFAADYFGDRATLLAGLIFLWPSLALDVKRWHDMGRSGYYTLIVNGPILAIYAAALTRAADVPEPQASRLMTLLALIFLVYFILLAARKGTPGANRFGPAEFLPFQMS
jgi:uncharacterized membrane protein YhaH (DUF805 family)